MTERQKIIYRLGQLYGYICSKNKNWRCSSHDKYAIIYPFKGFTIAFLAALNAHAIKPDDEYITYRIECIDPEFPQDEPITINEQGIWTIGQLQYNRDVKSLIESTGMTHEQIAVDLGITRLTVGRWYRGEVLPKPKSIFDLEEIILNTKKIAE